MSRRPGATPRRATIDADSAASAASEAPPAPFDLGGAIGPYVLSELLDVERLAQVVEAIAAYSSDPRVKRAAGQLRGGKRGGGRPACEDSTQLATMTALLETGAAPTVEFAAKITARTIQHSHSLDSTFKRLARKYREAMRHETTFSDSNAPRPV